MITSLPRYFRVLIILSSLWTAQNYSCNLATIQHTDHLIGLFVSKTCKIPWYALRYAWHISPSTTLLGIGACALLMKYFYAGHLKEYMRTSLYNFIKPAFDEYMPRPEVLKIMGERTFLTKLGLLKALNAILGTILANAIKAHKNDEKTANMQGIALKLNLLLESGLRAHKKTDHNNMLTSEQKKQIIEQICTDKQFIEVETFEHLQQLVNQLQDRIRKYENSAALPEAPSVLVMPQHEEFKTLIPKVDCTKIYNEAKPLAPPDSPSAH